MLSILNKDIFSLEMFISVTRRGIKSLAPNNPLPHGESFKFGRVVGFFFFWGTNFCRPHVPVLRGLNFEVKPGQYVALVGASGCGKSTTVGLIERFYDPLAGEILVDGMNVAGYNLSEYRKNISLVSQEPTYFPSPKANVLLVADAVVYIKERFGLIFFLGQFEMLPKKKSIKLVVMPMYPPSKH
jgi:hypothetical protein